MTDLFDHLYGPGYAAYGPPRAGHGNGSAPAPVRKADPEKEYVAAGPAWGAPRTPHLLSTTVDEIVARRGPRIYEAMDRDPACRAAKMALKLGIVAGGMDLAPADAPDAGVKARTPDQELAADLVDFVWRNVERLPDFEATVFDLLEAVRTGVRLAEFTLEPADSGEDAGKLVLASLRVKPNDAWAFRVDPYNAVVGVCARPRGGDPPAVFPPEKFVWLSWEPVDHDPRGTSIYQPAYEPWHLKTLAWPQLYKYLAQFGSPSLIGECAPAEYNPKHAPLDARGVADESAPPVDAAVRMAQELELFQSGSVYAHAAGAKVYTIAPSGNGEAFHAAIDLYDRQITHAILGTTSATMEAEHDSRAKGQTGENIVGMKIELGRKALAAALRGLFRRVIALNYGDDVAARLTPLVTFGQADAPDRPALWGAAGGLKSSGYLGESQVAELDQMIGLPIRDAEADEAKAKQKAEEAMAAQQAMQGPPPGDGGGDGAPPTSGGGVPKSPPPKARPKGTPAEFALDAPMPGPWHDADRIEAQRIVRAAFPSIAAMKRWEAGTETADNRRVVLEEIADRAKVYFTEAARGMQASLAHLEMMSAEFGAANFASPFETVARWRDSMARTLRRYYLAGALALLGPGELAPDEWETLRGQTEVQLDYLDGFAGDLLSGKQARDGTVGSRAGMYGQSIKTVAHAMERERAKRAGMTLERRVHVGDPADICPECKTEQAKKWQPIGTLKAIGACLCKTGCHCHFEFK